MAEKIELIKEKLDHSGVFDFQGVYSFIHWWLKDDQDYGVTEEKYSEKVSGSSRDIDIEWKATKKLSDYFKVEIKVKYEIRGLTDVEIETDGSKKKSNKGKLSLEFKGYITKDPDSDWATSPFIIFWRDFYDRFVVPARVDKVEDKIRDDVRDLKEEVKSFLDIGGRR